MVYEQFWQIWVYALIDNAGQIEYEGDLSVQIVEKEELNNFKKIAFVASSQD